MHVSIMSKLTAYLQVLCMPNINFKHQLWLALTTYALRIQQNIIDLKGFKHMWSAEVLSLQLALVLWDWP